MIFVPPNTGEPLVAGIICKISTDSTDGAYTVIELSLPAGGGAPLHTHQREDEIFYILDGVCEVTCDGKTHLAEAGAMVVLPKNSLHAFRNVGDKPNRILITAVPGGLDHYFAELAQIRNDDPEAGQKVADIHARYQIQF